MASNFNLSDTVPAAPQPGMQNMKWQSDSSSPTNVSAFDPPMIGDSGNGGKGGNVPAPAAGDAAAGKYLRADGVWAVPAASSASFVLKVNQAVVATSNNGFTLNVNNSLVASYS